MASRLKRSVPVTVNDVLDGHAALDLMAHYQRTETANTDDEPEDAIAPVSRPLRSANATLPAQGQGWACEAFR